MYLKSENCSFVCIHTQLKVLDNKYIEQLHITQSQHIVFDNRCRDALYKLYLSILIYCNKVDSKSLYMDNVTFTDPYIIKITVNDTGFCVPTGVAIATMLPPGKVF